MPDLLPIVDALVHAVGPLLAQVDLDPSDPGITLILNLVKYFPTLIVAWMYVRRARAGGSARGATPSFRLPSRRVQSPAPAPKDHPLWDQALDG